MPKIENEFFLNFNYMIEMFDYYSFDCDEGDVYYFTIENLSNESITVAVNDDMIILEKLNDHVQVILRFTKRLVVSLTNREKNSFAEIHIKAKKNYKCTGMKDGKKIVVFPFAEEKVNNEQEK